MSKIPMYGQKTSIPVWIAYLLQAEKLWLVGVVLIVGLLAGETGLVEELPGRLQVAMGLLLGAMGGPIIRVFVRAILRGLSVYVYSNVGPPPKGFERSCAQGRSLKIRGES